MRYTLRGLKAGNIEKAAEASALEPKARTIATLTDDDIYTYCALSGLEFSVKEGAYTNVREYDAIGNPCNANLSFARRHAGPRRPRTARPICSTTGTTTRSTCS